MNNDNLQTPNTPGFKDALNLCIVPSDDMNNVSPYNDLINNRKFNSHSDPFQS